MKISFFHRSDNAEQADKRLGRLEGQCAQLLEQMEALNQRVAESIRREAQVRAIIGRDIELEDRLGELDQIFAGSRSDHIARVVDRAVLEADPFPYIVADDVLPSELYRAAIRGLPPVELFSDRPVNKQQLKVPLRFAPAYSRRVWRFLTDVIIPDFVMPAVVKKFRAPLDEWITRNWPDVPPDQVELHSSDGRIIFRRRGYRIPPHRDPKWSFITGILYLARRGDSESWGTQMYSVDGDEEARVVSPHWIDPARCRPVGEVAFRPNRMLIFLNSVGAHGAHIPEDAQPEDLERYIYQFRIAPTVDAMRMLKQALSADRRALWAGKAAEAADY
jgi:hypothetical protein